MKSKRGGGEAGDSVEFHFGGVFAVDPFPYSSPQIRVDSWDSWFHSAFPSLPLHFRLFGVFRGSNLWDLFRTGGL